MRVKQSKKVYHVVLEYPQGVTQTVKVKAVSREVAERRALKFHRGATGVRREA